MYTYEYSPDVSLYDKGMQTEQPKKPNPQKAMQTSMSNAGQSKINQSMEEPPMSKQSSIIDQAPFETK